MLEILLIWSIANKIAANLKAKGRSSTGYVALFVFLWIAGEILGFVFGAIVETAMNPHGINDGFNFAIYLCALGGAAVGGTVGYLIANSVPPVEDERRRREFADAKWDDEEDDWERERRRRRAGADDGSNG